MKLSQSSRAALKAAVSRAPGWANYREAQGIQSVSSLGKPALLEAAATLGVDVDAVVGAAPASAPVGRPVKPVVQVETTDQLDGEETVIPADPAQVDGLVTEIFSAPVSEMAERVRELATRALSQRVVERVVRVDVPVPAPAPAPAPEAQEWIAPVTGSETGHWVPTKDLSEIQPQAERLPASKVFPGSKLTRLVTVWNDLEAPAVDPTFTFQGRDDVLEVALVALDRGQNLWLEGPHGSGKSEFGRQVAACLRRAFFRVPLTRTTEEADLIGGRGLENGSTRFDPGILIEAGTRPGAVILFDEYTSARAGALFALQSVLDGGREIVIKETGQRIPLANGVACWAADNTNGKGDASGRYADTNVLNASQVDRFAYTVHVDYLPKAVERRVLAHKAGVPEAAAGLLVDLAALSRRKVDTDDLQDPIGMRRLIAVASLLGEGVSADTAFTVAVINQATAEDREVLRTLWSTVDKAALERAVTGAPEPATEAEAAAEMDAYLDAAFADDEDKDIL